MIRKVYAVLIFTFVASSQVVFSSQEYDLNRIVDKLQEKYKNISDFHADFSQEVEVRALGKTQKSFGKVWFKKPDKMKWSYHSPTKDKIVSDGKKVFYYFEQDNQVMESTLENISEDTGSAMLLSGLGEIRKLFEVKFVNDKSLSVKNGDLLELTPKEGNKEDVNNRIVINVNRSSSLVDTIYLFDPFGNQTSISLLKPRTNTNISDRVFRFKPPKDAEVIKLPARR